METLYTLDFDPLKADIKSYIETNAVLLKDYNYEGSVINNVMNVMTYVTQYLSFYLNMSVNEMFLSSASIEENVYKLASMLNYLPKRESGSYVDVYLKSSAGSPVTLNKWDCLSDGTSTLYYMEDDAIVLPTSTIGSQVRLYLGELTSSSHTFSTVGIFNSVTMTDNFSIDDSHFEVLDASTDVWDNANTEPFLTTAVPADNKYFYIDYSTGTMSVKFDNGKLFRDPAAEADTITIRYLKVTGTVGNSTQVAEFTACDVANVTIADSESWPLSTAGGSAKDTVEEVKTKAPLWFVAQHRAVTEKDYNTIIENLPSFPSFSDIVIWGGEQEWTATTSAIVTISATGSGEAWNKGYIYYSALQDDLSDASLAQQAAIETYLDKYRIISLLYRNVQPATLSVDQTYSIKYLNTACVTAIQSSVSSYISTNYQGSTKEYRNSEFIRYVDSLTGVDYVSMTSAIIYNHPGFTVTVPTNVIRTFNALDSSVTITGSLNGVPSLSSSGTDLLFDSVTVGTIDWTEGQMFVTAGCLSAGAIEVDVNFNDVEYFKVEKETFLYVNDPSFVTL
jgi:hypothetical protein